MFRFEEPAYLYLLLLLPLLVAFYLFSNYRRRKAIRKFGDPVLMAQLMPDVSKYRPDVKFWLVFTAIGLFAVLLARPQFGSKLETVKRKGVEVMIALDISNSMLAQDVQPSRLEKAKMAISRMVEKLSNDKIGLIVFAGDAYVQLPITTDYSSAKLFLSNISTDIVPVQGTAIGSAIDLAARSFTPETETSKAIIVITDGENHQDDAVAAAKQAHEKGIVIHTIGMGLEQGAPIPEKGKPGQFMQDAQGNVVISKLDEQTLQDIAKAGEGLYIRASNTEVGLNRLLDEVNRMEKSLLEERVYSDYAEKYQYFLLVGLFFIFVEFMILGRKNKHFMKINLFKR